MQRQVMRHSWPCFIFRLMFRSYRHGPSIWLSAFKVQVQLQLRLTCALHRPVQVTELAAAVHKLNQDKCQLENQMEMEEVCPVPTLHSV